MIRKHKLLRIHVVVNTAGKLFGPAYQSIHRDRDYSSIAARITRKAALEFLTIISDVYQETPDTQRLYCGIGWSRTCERVVNLMPVSPAALKNLTVCPLIGSIGYEQTNIDASFLALRLAGRLSGTSIKLSSPCVQPLDMDIDNLPPIKTALNQIGQCSVGLSGIGIAYNKDNSNDSELYARDVITEPQLRRIRELNAEAELLCHYFDKDGQLIDFGELGFKPVGVRLDQMKRIPRFMIVVSPDRQKILPAIIAIKAGICSDLVLDHTMAHYILSDDYLRDI